MKKIIAVLVTALTFGMASPSNAASPYMQTYMNSVNLNKVYAEQILYCDSNLKFSAYQNAVFFDNNGACIDPSSLIFSGGDLEQWLNDTYPGGMNQWTVFSSSGKTCVFSIIQVHPHRGEYLVWETFFTACSVKLNEQVNDKWYMLDQGSTVSPVFAVCPADSGLIGYYDNCLDSGMRPQPSNPVNMIPGTIDYINGAANILKKKFYFDYNGWLSYIKKYKKLRFTMSTSPAGAKIYLQKWVDYKWVNVRMIERLWEGKSFTDYNVVSPGKYRIFARSITGKVWKSKTVLI